MTHRADIFAFEPDEDEYGVTAILDQALAAGLSEIFVFGVSPNGERMMLTNMEHCRSVVELEAAKSALVTQIIEIPVEKNS